MRKKHSNVTSRDTKNLRGTTSQISSTSSLMLVNFQELFCTCSQFLLTFTNPLSPKLVRLSIVHCSLSSRYDVKFFIISLPSITSGGQFSTGRHSNHLVELSAKAQTRMAATSLNWSENKAWKCNGQNYIKDPNLGCLVSVTWLFQFACWTGLEESRESQTTATPTVLQTEPIERLYLSFVFVFAYCNHLSIQFSSDNGNANRAADRAYWDC